MNSAERINAYYYLGRGYRISTLTLREKPRRLSYHNREFGSIMSKRRRRKEKQRAKNSLKVIIISTSIRTLEAIAEKNIKLFWFYIATS